MNKGDLKNIIPTVLSHAAFVSRQFGHSAKNGKKFGRHIVALAVQKLKNLKDRELADFLSEDGIGKLLGYTKKPNFSRFSQVRKVCIGIVQELYDMLVHEKFRGRQLHMIVQDSTDIFAYSDKDADARWGYRTPSKQEQIMQRKGNEKGLFFGYKPHLIVDVDTEIPIAVAVRPANRNDKKLFAPLFNSVEENFKIRYMAKYIADSQYDSTDVRVHLRDRNVIPVIATNGRGHYKSEMPNDPDYGKRWAIEHTISRLKKVLDMARNRYIGINRVTVHVYACLLAYIIKYLDW